MNKFPEFLREKCGLKFRIKAHFPYFSQTKIKKRRKINFKFEIIGNPALHWMQ